MLRFVPGAAVLVALALADDCKGDNPPPVPVPRGICGDGILSFNEQCDDGNADDEDSCTTACVAARCGDGICASFEGGNCEDDCGLDPCRDDCPDEPVCGNGVVDRGEDCDEWAEGEAKKNSETCDVDCTTPQCEDGVLNLLAGECCEPDESDDCFQNDADNGPDLGLCACSMPGAGGAGGSSGTAGAGG